MIHIEGMGMLGCLLALKLQGCGLNFTWHDKGYKFSAWQASTGCIYPTNNQDEMKAYDWWGSTVGATPVRMNLEVGDYWFNTKQPPHGWKYPIEEQCGELRRAGYTYHLNVQNFVLDTRAYFKDRMREDDGNYDTRVVAHSYPKSYLWGWHCKADVEFPFRTHATRRPCVTLRVNRFQTAYVYPCPGTGLWYMGSSMVNQTTAKELDPLPHVRRVRALLAQFGVRANPVSSAVQGWRPKPDALPAGQLPWEPTVLTSGSSTQVVLPAMGANGVRLGPLVVESALRAIMERP